MTEDAKKEQPKASKSEDKPTEPKETETDQTKAKEPESKKDLGHDFDDFRKSYLYGGRAGHEDNSSEDQLQNEPSSEEYNYRHKKAAWHDPYYDDKYHHKYEERPRKRKSHRRY